MNFYGFEFSYLDIGLAALLLFFFGIQMYYYFRYFRGVIRHQKKEKKDKLTFNNEQTPVSVVICARDEEENLRKFLPFFLEQDYPSYEVIVVNDASFDNTDDYLSLMMKSYPNLRTTFVPDGTTNLSTKKLGITLGIKAAKNELILLTDADCMPEGKDWITNLVRNFTPETEFVLGYGGYLQKKGFLNKLIKYDTLFVAIQYLGMAEAKRPYMGVGRNLAYRRETFFKMKGFAGTLNLQSGDDDLLVNRGATNTNTRIEVSADSVTWSEPKRTFKQWYAQKERHLSVSDKYNKKSKIRLAVEPISRGLFYLSVIGVIAFGVLSYNWITVGFGGTFFLIRYALQLFTINKSAKVLGERRFYLTIPYFDIVLPLISLFILIFGKKNRKIRWK
ncbi:MAG: glycosyltransferase [Porphyromonadaceae bacterium]|nr:glycosyltransferase [Porphyromonadaceae bacterium]